MDYEQKYKDLVEKLKKASSDPDWEDERFCCVINGHFSEIKESEDEIIRKALIEIVHDTTGDSLWIDYNVHKEDALDWLEKQGEQILANSAKTCKDEQKPTEWSEEDEENMNNALYILNQLKDTSSYEDDIAEKIIVWLKSLKQRIGG